MTTNSYQEGNGAFNTTTPTAPNNVHIGENDVLKLKVGQISYNNQSFSISNEATSPQAIYCDDVSLWIVDDTTNKVYRYNTDNTYTGTSFSVSTETTSPQGGYFDGSHHWIISGENKVYKYSSGLYTGTSFDLTNQTTSPQGGYFDGSHHWIISATNVVYKYDSSGNYTNTSFDTSNETSSAQGGYWDGANHWIIGENSQSVHQYDTSGTYTGFSFTTAGETTDIRDGYWDGKNHWVLDDTQKVVYKYNVPSEVEIGTDTLIHGAMQSESIVDALGSKGNPGQVLTAKEKDTYQWTDDLTDNLNNINEHKNKTDNPHQVTKTQVGLGNLPNAKSDSTTLNSSNTLATSKAVYDVNQNVESRWTVSGNDIHNANSGNIGIGTTDPQAKLHVEGDAIANNVMYKYTGEFKVGGSTNTYYPVIFKGESQCIQNIRLYRDGVHTDAYRRGAFTFEIYADTSSWDNKNPFINYLYQRHNQHTCAGTYDLVAYVATEERGTGVIVWLLGGTTYCYKSSSQLYNGNEAGEDSISITEGTVSSTNSKGTTPNTSATKNLRKVVDGVHNQLSFYTDGNVGIGTSSPNQKLSVNGNASKSGGGSWATYSDQRLKKDIQPFADGLEIIENINPVNFKYNGKAGHKADGKTYTGIVAQELYEHAPHMFEKVKTKLNDTDTEDTELYIYDGGNTLLYTLVNATKQQQTQAQAQQTQIQEQQTQIEQQQALMEKQQTQAQEQQTQIEQLLKRIELLEK